MRVLNAMLCLGMGLFALTASDAQDSTFVIPRDQFLRQLDLAQPELAAVKAALDGGDLAGAERAFVAYWRQRPIESYFLTDWPTRGRDPKYRNSTADAALAGHFDDGYSVYDAPPTGIDWQGCPLSCVTRFPLLGAPRWTYHHLRDPKYLRFMVDHIAGYMQAYPIADFVGKSAATGWTSHTVVSKPWYWCMIPERLYEWSETLNLIRTAPDVTDEELLAQLHRLYQECGYLETQIQKWVDMRHNGGCAMIRSLAMAATVLQDFPRAQHWLDFSAQLTAQYTKQSFYPDGMCVELTTAYSLGTSQEMQTMAYALRDREAIQALKPRVAAMITCLAALSDPLRSIPSFGDLYASDVDHGISSPVAGWAGLPWVKSVLDPSRLDAARTDASLMPPFTVWPVPGQEAWCGYYTMRSDWGRDATYMMIDGGPWGTTHQHGDRLSFVITANGAKFIIDPSGTRYAANTPDSFISRQGSGFLHNTITVDGVDEFSGDIPKESTAPLTNRWEHGANFSLFASRYSFKPVKPVDWERRMLYADKSYWLLQDVLTGDQPEAEVEQNFQFEADIKIEFRGSVTLATASNGAMLALIPLAEGLTPKLTSGDKEPHVSYWGDGKPKTILASEDGRDQKHGRGWTGRSSDKLIPAPAVTYTGKLKLPAQIPVLIVPLKPGQTLEQTPRVTHEGDVWTLPVQGGALRLETTPTGCRILP